MRFRNSTPWPDHFVRRMLRWVAREVDLPSGRLHAARFYNACNAWGGRGYSSGRIAVGVGRQFPTGGVEWSGYKRACRRPDGTYLTIADRLEALVIVTAHELGHVGHFSRGHYGRGSEGLADPGARKCLLAFRAQRADLERAWLENPPTTRVERPKLGIQERNALKAAKKLEDWSRKLKLAQGKVKKYRRAVARYERVAAAKGATK